MQEAADTADRVLEALALPLPVAHKELSLRCSIGISVVSQGTPAGAEELIRDADAAMYRAKRDGKGSYRLFEPEMHEGVLARLELRTDLQRAIATEQLELYYQPVVRIHDGSISGVEALLRWRHPERGMIPPDQFIPLAEETGTDHPDRALGAARGMPPRAQDARRPSARNGADDEHQPVGEAASAQRRHRRRARRGRGGRDRARPRSRSRSPRPCSWRTPTSRCTRLQELKALGVNLALDDFGTGYSSLSYLSRFPVDILKMDRSFLTDGATPEMSGLASAVLALGTTLKLDVVAEGIEQPEQWTSLRELGCEFGQGFFFARPMDAEAALEHLAAHRRRAGRRRPVQRRCTIATRPSTGRAGSRAWDCSRRCGTRSSGSCGRRCASRCSATAPSS